MKLLGYCNAEQSHGARDCDHVTEMSAETDFRFVPHNFTELFTQL